jgi:hypothetical protein
MIRCIFDMNTMKSLTIKFCPFASLPQEIVTNNSVEMLGIKYRHDDAADGIIFMLSNCLNVRKLCIESLPLTINISTAIAEMSNLQILQTYYCDIPPPYLAYPSVTSIEMHSFGSKYFFNDVIEVVRANPHIKCLRLPARVKFHPKYHCVMNELNLDELYWHSQEDIQRTLQLSTTLTKNLDNIVFVPFVVLFMYLFYLFVQFTSSDPHNYDM